MVELKLSCVEIARAMMFIYSEVNPQSLPKLNYYINYFNYFNVINVIVIEIIKCIVTRCVDLRNHTT